MKLRHGSRLLYLSIVLIVFSIVVSLLNFLNNTGQVSKVMLQNVVNLVAIVSGISGIIMGLVSLKMVNLDAVKEYFQQGDSDDFIAARKKVYELGETNERIEPYNSEVGKVVSFFHFWGLMVKKKYLPIWVFEDASGFAVVKLYRILEPHIEERRVDNPYYAKYFQWLAEEIEKKYKYIIEEFDKIQSNKSNS